MEIKVQVEVLPTEFFIIVKENEFVKEVLKKCLTKVNLLNEKFGLFLSSPERNQLLYLPAKALIFSFNPQPQDVLIIKAKPLKLSVIVMKRFLIDSTVPLESLLPTLSSHFSLSSSSCSLFVPPREDERNVANNIKRGICLHSNCDCEEYQSSISSFSSHGKGGGKCVNCGHYPSDHKFLRKLSLLSPPSQINSLNQKNSINNENCIENNNNNNNNNNNDNCNNKLDLNEKKIDEKQQRKKEEKEKREEREEEFAIYLNMEKLEGNLPLFDQGVDETTSPLLLKSHHHHNNNHNINNINNNNHFVDIPFITSSHYNNHKIENNIENNHRDSNEDIHNNNIIINKNNDNNNNNNNSNNNINNSNNNSLKGILSPRKILSEESSDDDYDYSDDDDIGEVIADDDDEEYGNNITLLHFMNNNNNNNEGDDKNINDNININNEDESKKKDNNNNINNNDNNKNKLKIISNFSNFSSNLPNLQLNLNDVTVNQANRSSSPSYPLYHRKLSDNSPLHQLNANDINNYRLLMKKSSPNPSPSLLSFKSILPDNTNNNNNHVITTTQSNNRHSYNNNFLNINNNNNKKTSKTTDNIPSNTRRSSQHHQKKKTSFTHSNNDEIDVKNLNLHLHIPKLIKPNNKNINNNITNNNIINSNNNNYNNNNYNMMSSPRFKKWTANLQKKNNSIDKITQQFGVPLDLIILRECDLSLPVPSLFLLLTQHISKFGLKQKGLFRLSGNQDLVNLLKDRLNNREMVNFMDYEMNVICSLFKQFLQSFPEPIIPFFFYDRFLTAIKMKGEKLKKEYVKVLISSLPKNNKEILHRLINFLSEVTKEEEANKMGIHNISIIFSPLILYSNSPDDIQKLKSDSFFSSLLIQFLISHRSHLFTGEEKLEVVRSVGEFIPEGALAKSTDEQDDGDEDEDEKEELSTCLRISPGNFIFIFKREKEKCFAEVDGKIGFFPSSYLSSLKSPPLSPSSSSTENSISHSTSSPSSLSSLASISLPLSSSLPPPSSSFSIAPISPKKKSPSSDSFPLPSNNKLKRNSSNEKPSSDQISMSKGKNENGSGEGGEEGYRSTKLKKKKAGTVSHRKRKPENKTLPSSLNPANVEDYIGEAEFLKIFKISKANYFKLPINIREKLKEEAGFAFS